MVTAAGTYTGKGGEVEREAPHLGELRDPHPRPLPSTGSRSTTVWSSLSHLPSPAPSPHCCCPDPQPSLAWTAATVQQVLRPRCSLGKSQAVASRSGASQALVTTCDLSFPTLPGLDPHPGSAQEGPPCHLCPTQSPLISDTPPRQAGLRAGFRPHSLCVGWNLLILLSVLWV